MKFWEMYEIEDWIHFCLHLLGNPCFFRRGYGKPIWYKFQIARVFIHSHVPDSITDAITLASWSMNTPWRASNRWSWAGTRTRTLLSDLAKTVCIGGGSLVWDTERPVISKLSTGLVGTEAVGEAEGIGELLVCQNKGIQMLYVKLNCSKSASVACSWDLRYLRSHMHWYARK